MRTTLDFFLVFTALIPATFLFGISLEILSFLLHDWESGAESFLFLFIIIFGITGYFGLILYLFPLNKKQTRVSAYMMSAGVMAIFTLISLSGSRAWIWILTMKEPGEWFLLMWPNLVAIYLITKVFLFNKRNNIIFTFRPLTINDVQTIQTWRYAGFEKNIFMQPYLDSFHQTGKLIGPGGCEGFAAFFQDELVGLFEFYNDSHFMNIGLALKPELTGKGLGCDFVLQGIDFGTKHYQYQKKKVELIVNRLNFSAVRVYEKAGFEKMGEIGEEIKMSKTL